MKLENIGRAADLYRYSKELEYILKTLQYNQKYDCDIILHRHGQDDVKIDKLLPKEFKDYVVSTHIKAVEDEIQRVNKDIESL